MTIPCVDVRDCAQAHISAIFAEPNTLKNKRIAIVRRSYQLIELLKLIQNKFYNKGLKQIPTQDIHPHMKDMLTPFYDNVSLVIPQFLPGICTELHVSHL